MSQADYLVPNRSCGECMICCIEPVIADPELQKPGRVACGNCLPGGGCAIYPQRPQACRTFHCLWRQLPNLDEDWRPDRSGVFMVLSDHPVPCPNGVTVELIVHGSPEVIVTRRFASMAAGFLASGTAVFLNLPGPVGSGARHAALQDFILEPALARDLDGVLHGLQRCLGAILIDNAVADQLAGSAMPRTGTSATSG